MSHSRQSSSFGAESFVDLIQNILKHLSDSISKTEATTFDGNVYPLDAFSRDHRHDLAYFPPGETQLEVSLLSWAAYKGLNEVIYALIGISEQNEQLQDHLDDALFLAHFANHKETADLLMDFGANPGRRFRSNGLHGAVRRRQIPQIKLYIRDFGVPADVEDWDFATPVMYAMQLEHPYDLETISHLFSLGADPQVEFGDEGWNYAQYALAMGKKDLAEWLEVKWAEAEAKAKLTARTTPTSSRESSCTIGRD
ncbi:Ankyrin repeat-containing domain superfamily [Fusarium oxysporum f. sp. vasinfectum]|nr:Ankyrin repeat-containing domain superfamily [Fusarium oxysporum f. sp. vasinfectum]